MALPNCSAPCKDCPFLKTTLKGWLGKERMQEITEATTFVCHKNHELQCAGHMLLLGNGNSFVNLAQWLNLPLKLKGREKVFNTIQECIEHHG